MNHITWRCTNDVRYTKVKHIEASCVATLQFFLHLLRVLGIVVGYFGVVDNLVFVFAAIVVVVVVVVVVVAVVVVAIFAAIVDFGDAVFDAIVFVIIIFGN